MARILHTRRVPRPEPRKTTPLGHGEKIRYILMFHPVRAHHIANSGYKYTLEALPSDQRRAAGPHVVSDPRWPPYQRPSPSSTRHSPHVNLSALPTLSEALLIRLDLADSPRHVRQTNTSLSTALSRRCDASNPAWRRHTQRPLGTRTAAKKPTTGVPPVASSRITPNGHTAQTLRPTGPPRVPPERSRRRSS